MIRVDPSVKNFVDNPADYLLKITYGKRAATLSADKKGIWTWIKTRFYEFLGYGSYDLARACYAINSLDPIPEHSALKQSANKVIEKWNTRHNWSIEKFDQYQVTLRPNIELTLEKVLELANTVLKDRNDPIDELFQFSTRDSTIQDIERRCKAGLLAHPEIYINRWIRERGGHHSYTIPDDLSMDIFKTHIFTIIDQRTNREFH